MFRRKSQREPFHATITSTLTYKALPSGQKVLGSNSKLASAQFGSTRSPTVQCLWLCGQSQPRHRESRYMRLCANSLRCARQRPCRYSLLINASLASCWYQHRFRTLLRSPRIFSWHGFSNSIFWYLHADTDDLATRSGQNLKSPGFIQKTHSYWCLSSKWFSEISFSSRNHNVCQSWECEMGTDSERPFENWVGGGGFSIASDFFVSILGYGWTMSWNDPKLGI